MNIVVCVKYVPDATADRQFESDNTVDRVGVDGLLSELDEYAVEQALQLKEKAGDDTKVTALCVGPEKAVDAVRKALQMGADEGVHVLDDAIAGSDVFGTVAVLAAAVRRLDAEAPVDLVLTGMAGLDGLTSLVPAALAAELDLPQLTLASELTVSASASGWTARVRRDLDHATEVLEAPLPALVSVTDQANEPRYPNFKGIMAARKKPVEVLGLADLGIEAAVVGDAGARTEVVDAARRPARENRILVTDDGDAGLRLAAYLVENKLV